jgi:fructokinase
VKRPLLGGVEGGGTKFTCALSDEPGRIGLRATIRTTSPTDTLGQVVAFFKSHAREGPIAALGIASFGPIDLRLGSQTYGHITSTPKPDWQNVDIVDYLDRALAPDTIAFDTDVNAAALAEHRWGAGRGTSSLAYVTVGTGIGAGFVINGGPLHGLVHSEFGHIRIPRDPQADPYRGCCPNHGDCLEGLASGRALAMRWGVPPDKLPDDHPAWALETDYLALGLSNLICMTSPERVVIGGGVARRLNWRTLRTRVQATMGDYLHVPELTDAIDDYLIPPALGDSAGLIGALTLAQTAAETALLAGWSRRRGSRA